MANLGLLTSFKSIIAEPVDFKRYSVFTLPDLTDSFTNNVCK